MPKSDVAFTFDPAPFTKGVQKANKSLDIFHTGLLKTGAIAAIGGATAGIAMAGVTSALRGTRKIFSSFMKELPEIGKTFGIIRQIFMRNFLWPIRKALMPLLQKMLNWVRDHRTMFVKWGQIVVTIFKTIVGWVQRAIKFFRKLSEGLIQFVNRTFGMQIKKISELFNVLTFKIVAVFQYIGALIAPIFKKIMETAAEIGKFLIEPMKAFFEGIDLTGIIDSFGLFWDSLKNVFTTLRNIDERTGAITATFKTLGIIIGGALRISLMTAAIALNHIAFQIEKIPANVRIIALQIKRLTEKSTEEDINRLNLAYVERAQIQQREIDYYVKAGKEIIDVSKKTGIAIIDTWSETQMAKERRARLAGATTPVGAIEAGLEELRPELRAYTESKLIDYGETNINVENVNIESRGDARRDGDDFIVGLYNKLFDALTLEWMKRGNK